PHVGRVMGDVDGEVAHQLDPALRCPVLERLELGEEEILLAPYPLDVVAESAAPAVERRRVALRRPGVPVGPADPAVRLLERHEKRVVLEPLLLLLDERMVTVVRDESVEGAPQKGTLVGDDALEVDGVRGEVPAASWHVDEERVPRERRETL